MRLRRDQAAGWSGPPTLGQSAAASAEGGLLGSWSATRWQYTSRHQAVQMVDVVCDLRGNVTLSLSQGTYVLAWDIPGNGSRSIGGFCAVGAEEIEFAAPGRDAVERVTFHLGTETLSLRCEASAWDFDGHGQEEPADFVAVFVKL
jgi:hypothetical protein